MHSGDEHPTSRSICPVVVVNPRRNRTGCNTPQPKESFIPPFVVLHTGFRNFCDIGTLLLLAIFAETSFLSGCHVIPVYVKRRGLLSGHVGFKFLRHETAELFVQSVGLL